MIDHMADPDFRTASDRTHVSDYVGDGTATSRAGLECRIAACWCCATRTALAPGREFGRLCTFLGVRPSSARLEQAIAASRFETLQKQERSNGFKERAPHAKAFFRQGKADAWRDVLSLEQAERICAKAGRTMQRFGYIAVQQPTVYENRVE